jgi:hypothetical protein
MSSEPLFLGIDFGTSCCSMAWFNSQAGQAEVIRNAEGEEKTPSAVYFGPSETLAGTPAERRLDDEEGRKRVLLNFKRDLGRGLKVSLAGRRVSPLDAASELLAKLKCDAEQGHFHAPVSRVVLTHPAAFDALEQDRLREAAQRAGFAEVALLAEPVAAALAHARGGLKLGQRILICDLGGGKFDLALLARQPDGTFQMAAEPRSLRYGGEDIDRALYDHCDEVAERLLGRAISPDGMPDNHFLRACRDCKENLSFRERCELSATLSGGVRFEHVLDRATLDGLIRSQVEATVQVTRSLVEEAQASGPKIDTVILIGGSSRVPLVERLLTEALPVPPLRWPQMDVAVALGAACEGQRLWGPASPAPAPTSWEDDLLEQVNTALGSDSNPDGDASTPAPESLEDDLLAQVDAALDVGGISGPRKEKKTIPPLSPHEQELLAQVEMALGIPSEPPPEASPASDAARNLRTFQGVTEADLARIARETAADMDLRLDFDPGITNEGLAPLGRLKNVRELSFHGCREITDDGLKHLAGLARLKKLTVSSCDRVKGRGLVHLSGLRELEELDLRGQVEVSDDNLSHLRGLTRLKKLELAGCSQVTDRGVGFLAGLTSLEELDLEGTRITDAGLALLRGLTNLRRLNLRQCNGITDAGLVHLHQLRKLESFAWTPASTGWGARLVNRLTGRRVSSSGLAALQRALPECKIDTNG